MSLYDQRQEEWTTGQSNAHASFNAWLARDPSLEYKETTLEHIYIRSDRQNREAYFYIEDLNPIHQQNVKRSERSERSDGGVLRAVRASQRCQGLRTIHAPSERVVKAYQSSQSRQGSANLPQVVVRPRA